MFTFFGGTSARMRPQLASCHVIVWHYVALMANKLAKRTKVTALPLLREAFGPILEPNLNPFKAS